MKKRIFLIISLLGLFSLKNNCVSGLTLQEKEQIIGTLCSAIEKSLESIVQNNRVATSAEAAFVASSSVRPLLDWYAPWIRSNPDVQQILRGCIENKPFFAANNSQYVLNFETFKQSKENMLQDLGYIVSAKHCNPGMF